MRLMFCRVRVYYNQSCEKVLYRLYYCRCILNFHIFTIPGLACLSCCLSFEFLNFVSM